MLQDADDVVDAVRRCKSLAVTYEAVRPPVLRACNTHGSTRLGSARPGPARQMPVTSIMKHQRIRCDLLT